jgi:hypothetical protein
LRAAVERPAALCARRVRAPFLAAADRPAAPLVRAALRAAAERSAAVRLLVVERAAAELAVERVDDAGVAFRAVRVARVADGVRAPVERRRVAVERLEEPAERALADELLRARDLVLRARADEVTALLARLVLARASPLAGSPDCAGAGLPARFALRLFTVMVCLSGMLPPPAAVRCLCAPCRECPDICQHPGERARSQL